MYPEKPHEGYGYGEMTQQYMEEYGVFEISGHNSRVL